MSVKTQYDGEMLCRIEARGNASLADIHVELRRHAAGPRADARILLDLRGAVLRANDRDVRVFHRYLTDELMPHLEDRESALAWLPGVDPDLINPAPTGLRQAIADLAVGFGGFRVAEDVEDVDILLRLP